MDGWKNGGKIKPEIELWMVRRIEGKYNRK